MLKERADTPRGARGPGQPRPARLNKRSGPPFDVTISVRRPRRPPGAPGRRHHPGASQRSANPPQVDSTFDHQLSPGVFHKHSPAHRNARPRRAGPPGPGPVYRKHRAASMPRPQHRFLSHGMPRGFPKGPQHPAFQKPPVRRSPGRQPRPETRRQPQTRAEPQTRKGQPEISIPRCCASGSRGAPLGSFPRPRARELLFWWVQHSL